MAGAPQRPMVRTSSGGVKADAVTVGLPFHVVGAGPVAADDRAGRRMYDGTPHRLQGSSMPATPFRPDIPIDRTSGTPLYSQIAEALATLILDGALEPGTRLEDEVSMARRLEVSRPTARQALQRLVDRGLISRRRGAGGVSLYAPLYRLFNERKRTALHSLAHRDCACDTPATVVLMEFKGDFLNRHTILHTYPFIT